MQSLFCISVTDMKIDSVIGYYVGSSFALVVVKDQVTGRRMGAIGSDKEAACRGGTVFEVGRDCFAVIRVSDVFKSFTILRSASQCFVFCG